MFEKAYKFNASTVEWGYVTFLENFQNKRVYTKSAVEIDPSNRRDILKNSGIVLEKIYENKLFHKVMLPLNYWFQYTTINVFILASYFIIEIRQAENIKMKLFYRDVEEDF